MRILLLADSHIGFERPVRPRVARRHRGDDFLDNLWRALEPARRGEVDIVVHGGDVFNRSKPAPMLVQQALEPMLAVADLGVPVCVVPGNHERGRFPCRLLAAHPGLHIFDRPATLLFHAHETTVALGGFPFVRDIDAARFATAVGATRLQEHKADIKLLCMHQTVEGAQVGPGDYTFRPGHDVISGPWLPGGVAAVLSGHIHRHQVLTRALDGEPLPAPVFYPGSVERTSFAEKDEEKGAVLLELAPNGQGGHVLRWSFSPLPSRPMVRLDLSQEPASEAALAACLAALPQDAIVRLELWPAADRSVFGAIRASTPSTMAVTLRLHGQPRPTAA